MRPTFTRILTTQTILFTLAFTALGGGTTLALEVETPTTNTGPEPICHATPDNGTTVFSSADAQAVRDAVSAARVGATVKMAGTCAGVSGGQVINIAQALTLSGGYTPTNWVTALPPHPTHQTGCAGRGAGHLCQRGSDSGKSNCAKWLYNGWPRRRRIL